MFTFVKSIKAFAKAALSGGMEVPMENLVNKIIEIDRTAEEKLKQAHQDKEQAIKRVDQRKQEIMNEVSERGDKKLAAFEQSEKLSADEQIQAIRKRLFSDCNRLQKQFDQDNAKWTDQLVNRVLGK